MQRFNLATMSGVFPGTRTQIYQRVRLRSLTPPHELIWAQLLWYEAPAACVVYRQGVDQPWETTPLLRLSEPLERLNERLNTELRTAGWQLLSCGACQFWQPQPSTGPDGLPAGACRWPAPAGGAVAPSPRLAVQSTLALDCLHWSAAVEPSPTATAPQVDPAPAAVAPLRKIAELSESKLRFWPRLRRRMLRLLQPTAAEPAWEEQVVERSGVGAGTEPCFACQGRLANVGALAVETPTGDKQTLSVWRCRNCYTLYLNDWIDRWERLESLETEERYYRVAPDEARQLLELIYRVPGGEHPGRRRERQPERERLLDFMRDRQPLSHQIRQGR